jgi:hypothetical protein
LQVSLSERAGRAVGGEGGLDRGDVVGIGLEEHRDLAGKVVLVDGERVRVVAVEGGVDQLVRGGVVVAAEVERAAGDEQAIAGGVGAELLAPEVGQLPGAGSPGNFAS